MRGTNDPQVSFTTRTPEQVVPADRPIRAIKPIVDAALRELDPDFNEMYSDVGRPSTPPENLLKACVLMAFYSIRSERQFAIEHGHDLAHVPLNVRFQQEGDEGVVTVRDAGGRGIELMRGLMDVRPAAWPRRSG